MFDIFKEKKKIDLSSLDKNTKEILVASILVECAKSDGVLGNDEEQKIKTILSKKLNLNDQELKEIFDEALKDSDERVELYSLTKNIRENFSHEEIIEIFVYMWEVILIDNMIDDFESSLMRKATGLFHLSGRDSAEAKKKAEDSISNQ